MPCLEDVGLGKLQVGSQCDWLGMHIRLSVVVLSWKQGQKLGEVVSYSPSSGYFELIVPEVIV